MEKRDNGLSDRNAMIDKLIADLNNAVKYLFAGQCVAFCDAIRLVAQGLDVLKKCPTGEDNDDAKE